jgi:hypothetical protein
MPDLMLFLLNFTTSFKESGLKAALRVALVFDYYSLTRMASSLRSSDCRRRFNT